jgi:hypothetical protein
MGSFKGDERGQGRPGRRRGDASRRRGVAPDFECLEGRALMAVGDLPRQFQPVNNDLANVKNGRWPTRARPCHGLSGISGVPGNGGNGRSSPPGP